MKEHSANLTSRDGNKDLAMKKEKYLEYILSGMIFVNFSMLVFLQYTMIYVTTFVKKQGIARKLISNMSVIPFQVYRASARVIFIFVMLILLMEIKRRIDMDKQVLRVIIIIEVLFCIFICWYSCVEYNGVLLLVAADIIYRIENRHEQFIFLLIMGFIYIACSHNVMAIGTRLVAFSDYLIVFSRVEKSAILMVKDILTSVNIICFVIYMVILMMKQMEEKEEFLILNTKLNIMNDELKDANVKLKDYAALQKQLGETEERNRIAREIHDTLGHTMTGLAAGLDACKMLIDISVPDTKENIIMLGDVAREGLNDIRRSVNKLRPDVLENRSLNDAIKRLIKQNIDMANVAIYYTCSIHDMKFEPDEENVIYRIVQEGMTNAIRHGKATMICIDIKREDGMLIIEIKDNGCGCDDIVAGFGLTHMKERIDMLHGEISYIGTDGFTVIAKIPIRWREEND